MFYDYIIWKGLHDKNMIHFRIWSKFVTLDRKMPLIVIYREVDSVFTSSVPSINRDILFIAFIELAVVICRCENQKESTHY